MISSLTFVLLLLNVAIAFGGGKSSTINIGNGRPEGITEGPGPYFFVGEFFYGGVRKVSIKTMEIVQRVPSFGFGERLAVGIWYANGAIWVAGGGPFLTPGVIPSLHVYNDDTGEEIVSCPVDSAVFFNDVTVYDGVVYITDSGSNILFTADVNDALAGICTIGGIVLPEDPFLPEVGAFVSNGIVAYKDGLILGTTYGDGIYYHDLYTKLTYQIASGDVAPSADGIVVRGNIFYTVENSSIAVYKARKRRSGLVTTQRIGTILSDTFDAPKTVAIFGKNLYVPNSRFLSFPAPAEGEEDPITFSGTFNVSVVSRRDFA